MIDPGNETAGTADALVDVRGLKVHFPIRGGFFKRRLGLQLINVDVTRFFHARR